MLEELYCKVPQVDCSLVDLARLAKVNNKRYIFGVGFLGKWFLR
jgi:hypothetical protein